MEPTITKPPVSEIEVEINGTFEISCQAIGTPTPLIVWRLNWGNIPSGDRVQVLETIELSSMEEQNKLVNRCCNQS